MKVRKFPIDPGLSGWTALLPPADPFPSLEENMTADWLIIGAGFAGLSAARRLRQLRPSDRIVVLEARRVADGPAGRNSGFMIDLPHDLASDDYGGDVEADRRLTRANRAAIAFAGDAAAEYGMDGEAYAISGKINAAATDKGMRHNADYKRHLAALGENCEMLDAAAMKAVTGIDYYKGGLFTPGAAMLQPAKYIRGLAQGLGRPGVSLFEQSPVTGLHRKGRIWRAETPNGRIETPKVILAVNGHAESFGYFERRLMHVFTYASMTRALTREEAAALGGDPVWGLTPADPMGTTVRRVRGAGGDRIVIRNRFTYDPSMQVSDRRIRSVGKDHEKAFSNRFPILSDVSMEYRWGGRLCLSRNNVGAYGEIEPGLFSACCQNGLGTARGTYAGILAAEQAAGAPSPLLMDIEKEPAPRRLPPEPVAWLGANAFIRWNELRAGKEF